MTPIPVFRPVRLAWLAVPFLALLSASPALAGQGSKASLHRSRPDAYVLRIGERWVCDNVDGETLDRVSDGRKGDVLWFRRDGKAYRIEDRATLGQAAALFAALDTLEPEQSDLEARQRALEKEERALDREEEKVDRLIDIASGDEDDDDDGSAVTAASEADEQALEARMREIQGRQRELEGRERELDAAEESLDAREEAIEAQAETKLWDLIDAAIESGLATPAP
jgi:chromosome segregation ATPase